MHKTLLALSVLGSLALVSGANAAVVIGGSIAGDPIYAQWELPVLSGVAYDGATRAPIPEDNTSGAVYDLGSQLPANQTTITWGTPAAGSAANYITFTGSGSIPASKGSTPFSLGSFSYFNGSTLSNTNIFGSTLVFYAVGLDGNIPIGSIDFGFNQTANDGTAAQNADWLSIPGVSTALYVYEGAAVTGELNGLIIGDPQVVPLSFTLDPNQSANGFIAGAGAIPEPSIWAMMLLGFACLGVVSYRASGKNAGLAV